MEEEISGASARPSVLATLAGGATIATGLTALVSCVQLWSLFYLTGWRFYALILLGMASIAQLVLGGFTLTGGDVATIATTALTWLLQLVALFVVVWSFSFGLLSPLLAIWLGMNGLASMMLPIAVPAALRTSANRRKLYAD